MPDPLVTFSLVAYNQELFIREAVEGALSQTYSPLEIILSDDCSPDRTFEIMQEMAAAYRGPHEIVLNRNPKNLGLGAHINKTMEISRGELVLSAAGDDVSLPQRSSRVVCEWRASGFRTGSIFSNTEEFGDGVSYIQSPSVNASSCLLDIVRGSPLKLIGSSHAWTRDLFVKLGNLNSDVVNEDGAIFVRSCLLGQVIHIQEPLVRHRQHSSNLGASGRKSVKTHSDLINYHLCVLKRMSSAIRNLRDDLTKCASAGIATNYDSKQLSFISRQVEIQLDYLDTATKALVRPTPSRIASILCLAVGRNAVSRYMRRVLPQLLFPSLYLLLKSAVSR